MCVCVVLRIPIIWASSLPETICRTTDAKLKGCWHAWERNSPCFVRNHRPMLWLFVAVLTLGSGRERKTSMKLSQSLSWKPETTIRTKPHVRCHHGEIQSLTKFQAFGTPQTEDKVAAWCEKRLCSTNSTVGTKKTLQKARLEQKTSISILAAIYHRILPRRALSISFLCSQMFLHISLQMPNGARITALEWKRYY